MFLENLLIEVLYDLRLEMEFLYQLFEDFSKCFIDFEFAGTSREFATSCSNDFSISFNSFNIVSDSVTRSLIEDSPDLVNCNTSLERLSNNVTLIVRNI